MSELTLDEAIKHCLEVAEKNDGEAEVYDLLAKNHNNTYEKLTASRFYTDCAECAADHRQLAEWLMELKDLRAEQNEQYVFIRELMDELKEAKRLLKVAVKDIHSRDYCNGCIYESAEGKERYLNCEYHNCFKWRYADEAEKLIGDKSNGI